jgi:preprotein translocase subunit SecF
MEKVEHMRLIKPGTNIDFIGRRKIAYTLSLAMILATFVALIWRGGPNFGVDFSGGILIQIKLDTKQTPSAMNI